MPGPKQKIMKGDRVKVIRGNYRDLEGSVLEVMPEADRVRVEGVNERKRHTRPSQSDPDGGIMTIVAPIHVSNVMLVDSETGKPSRVRIQRDAGRRVRVFAKSGQPVPEPNS